jgi:hypothetical protein
MPFSDEKPPGVQNDRWIPNASLMMVGYQPRPASTARRLSEISIRLANAWAWMAEFPKVSEEDKAEFSQELKSIAVESQAISLSLTARQARRVGNAVSTAQTYQELQSLYDALQTRLGDELQVAELLT